MHFENDLKDSDLNGFAAAGVLIWRKRPNGQKQYLMALEYRNRVTRLNFIGGKRDTLTETPIKTGLRELGEETFMKLPMDTTMRTLVWLPESKFVMAIPKEPIPENVAEFVIKNWTDRTVSDQPNDFTMDEGLRGFRWVNKKQLRKGAFVRAEIHQYTWGIVKTLLNVI
jgi:hypothetical protein